MKHILILILGLLIAVSCSKEELVDDYDCPTTGLFYDGKFYPRGEGCNTASFVVSHWHIHINDDCEGNGVSFRLNRGDYTLVQECK